MHIRNIVLVLLAFISLQTLAQVTLPANMFADSAHAPFYYGVASGDPLADRVIVWTHITPDSFTAASDTVMWEVFNDPAGNVLHSYGIKGTNANFDWTVQVDLVGLQPNTTYYYRFNDRAGNFSPIGRTRTAPSGATDSLKFAVASCSSVFGGFFNAYNRIAERDDLNAVIHLGDYIYDFPDNGQLFRIPDPSPPNPQTLDDWRNRHELYLLDPDLRLARQMHPFIVLPDNHDFERDETGPDSLRSIQAFREWVPSRYVDSTDVKRFYQSFSYGTLADLILIDANMYKGDENLASGAPSIIGPQQHVWLQNQISSSTAKWRLYGNQKQTGGWYTTGIDPGLLALLPNSGSVFNDKEWDGYTQDRDSLFSYWLQTNPNNNVMLSGDMHISSAMDLVIDPYDTSMYNAETGAGAIGVEFLPTSVTRSNFDERGVSASINDAAVIISEDANPHHVFSDFIAHGYGLITISADSVQAQFWHVPILQQTTDQLLAKNLVVEDGVNHWRRESADTIAGLHSLPTTLQAKIYPNPFKDAITIDLQTDTPERFDVTLYNMQGYVTVKQQTFSTSPGAPTQVQLPVTDLPKGYYLLHIAGSHSSTSRFLLKQ